MTRALHYTLLANDWSSLEQIINDLASHIVDEGVLLPEYLLADGSRELSANWDAGAFSITANNFISTAAIGISPYACTSTTLNTNLNADLLDGQHGSYYATASGYVPYTGATGGVNLGAFGLTAASITDTGLTITRVPYVSTGGLLADSANLAWNNTSQILSTANLSLTGYIDLLEEDDLPDSPDANISRIFSIDEAGFTVLKYKDSTGMVGTIVRDSIITVKNVTGTAIAKRSCVYATGNVGGVPTVGLAKSDSITTMPAIGITIEEIADGSFGRVLQVGLLEDVDTAGLNIGTVYVSDTDAGYLQAARPVTPHLTQEIGTVLLGLSSAGKIQVITRGITGNEYGTLQNTFIIGDGLTGSKTLTFNSATDASIIWDETKFNFGSVTINPTTNAVSAANYYDTALSDTWILYCSGASGLITGNAMFNYDAANNSLGAGVAHNDGYGINFYKNITTDLTGRGLNLVIGNDGAYERDLYGIKVTTLNLGDASDRDILNYGLYCSAESTVGSPYNTYSIGGQFEGGTGSISFGVIGSCQSTTYLGIGMLSLVSKNAVNSAGIYVNNGSTAFPTTTAGHAGIVSYISEGRTVDCYSIQAYNTATDSADGLGKYGMYVKNTGIWNGSASISYGLRIVENTQLVVTKYGIYLDAMTGGAVTGGVKVCLYQVGTENNILGGNCRFSGTTAPTNAISLDAEDKIDFRDNAIHISSQTDGHMDIESDTSLDFIINSTEQIKLSDGKLSPTTNNDIDLGETGLAYKNMFVNGVVNHNAITTTICGSKTLTDGSATGFVTIALATTESVGGLIEYTIYVTTADPYYQVHCGGVGFVANNDGGVYTTEIQETYIPATEIEIVTSGTLTDAFTITTGTNTITLNCNANTSLASATLTLKYKVTLYSLNAMTLL